MENKVRDGVGEDCITRAIQSQTSRNPSSAYLAAAFGAMASIQLNCSRPDRRTRALGSPSLTPWTKNNLSNLNVQYANRRYRRHPGLDVGLQSSGAFLAPRPGNGARALARGGMDAGP